MTVTFIWQSDKVTNIQVTKFYAFFNDTQREKLLYSIQYKNGWLAASDLFHVFTQSVKFFYTFYYM